MLAETGPVDNRAPGRRSGPRHRCAAPRVPAQLQRVGGGWEFEGEFYPDYLTIGGASHAIYAWQPTPELVKEAVVELGCEVVATDEGPDAMRSFHVAARKR